MEENIVEEKKKSNVGLIVFLILIILGLAGYICYDKFYKKDLIKTDEKSSDKKQDLDAGEKDKCIGYKTFTKYEEDNLILYNQCVAAKFDEFGSYSFYDDINKLSLGLPNIDESANADNSINYTNKEGDNITEFGRAYASINGQYNYNFLLTYINTGDTEDFAHGCFSKTLLESLSNQIYGTSERFIADKDTFIYSSNNVYCLDGGFGPYEPYVYESQNKNGNKWTIKYKNNSDLDTTGKKYATIDFELKDGYWTVQNFKLSDN